MAVHQIKIAGWPNRTKRSQVSKFTTQRKEDDKVNAILSELILMEITSIISMIIYNKDMKSRL